MRGGVPVSPRAASLQSSPDRAAGAVYLPRTAAYGKTSTVHARGTPYLVHTHRYVTYFFPGAPGARARRPPPTGRRLGLRRPPRAGCHIAFDCHKINISNTFPYTLRHTHTHCMTKNTPWRRSNKQEQSAQRTTPRSTKVLTVRPPRAQRVAPHREQGPVRSEAGPRQDLAQCLGSASRAGAPTAIII